MNTLQLEIQNLPQIFKPEKQTQSTASETRNKRDKFLNENFLQRTTFNNGAIFKLFSTSEYNH